VTDGRLLLTANWQSRDNFTDPVTSKKIKNEKKSVIRQLRPCVNLWSTDWLIYGLASQPTQNRSASLYLQTLWHYTNPILLLLLLFWRRSSQLISCLSTENWNKHNKSKHASITKYTRTQNKHKKLKPGSVASYYLQPANEMVLFLKKISKEVSKRFIHRRNRQINQGTL